VQYSKSKKEKKFVNITAEVLIKQNAIILQWNKEIFAVIRGIEKFLISLSLKPFCILTDCKGILGFVKRIYQICKCKGDSCIGNSG